MLLTVRNRTVTIDDELANRYEKIGMGPIDELFPLHEISVTHRQNADEILDTLSDEVLVKTLEDAIMDYLDVSGV